MSVGDVSWALVMGVDVGSCVVKMDSVSVGDDGGAVLMTTEIGRRIFCGSDEGVVDKGFVAS